jgi:enterochelin esterase-like enzyme
MGDYVRREIGIVAKIVAFGLVLASTSAYAQCANDNLTRMTGNKECIAIRTFTDGSAVTPKKLVIFLHGDQSDRGPVVGMINIARDIAVPPGTVKVAVLRPGYVDRDGNKSTGENYDRNDSYTGANVDEIVAVITKLKAFYNPVRTVIVGHSGGAAYTGIMIGRAPGIADAALMLSCPCDIDRWRPPGKAWVRSLSPNKFADAVPATTRVILMTGSSDMNTFPSLADAYVKQLAGRGVPAEFRQVPGIDHNGMVNKDLIAAPLASLLN